MRSFGAVGHPDHLAADFRGQSLKVLLGGIQLASRFSKAMPLLSKTGFEIDSRLPTIFTA